MREREPYVPPDPLPRTAQPTANAIEDSITADMEPLFSPSYFTLVAMDDAITQLDSTFGMGYAKNHPEALGALIQAQAVIYHARAQMASAAALTDALEQIALDIANMKPNWVEDIRPTTSGHAPNPAA